VRTTITNKLDKDSNKNICKDLSPVEIVKLLEIYLVICKNEENLYQLVYSLHGSDSYEDIFRYHDYRLLEDKAQGVEEALDTANKNLKESK
jgi:hypothetical protein